MPHSTSDLARTPYPCASPKCETHDTGSLRPAGTTARAPDEGAADPAVRCRRFKTDTTKWDIRAQRAPDLVERDFSADGPDRLWVADITQSPNDRAGCVSRSHRARPKAGVFTHSN